MTTKTPPVPPPTPALTSFHRQRGGVGQVLAFENGKFSTAVVEDYKKLKDKINPTAGQPWGSDEADKEVIALEKYTAEAEAWAKSHGGNPHAADTPDSTGKNPNDEPDTQFGKTAATPKKV